MSVPEPDRNPSKVEFLNNFHKLRKEVNILMMRDFGIKARTYDVELISDIYELSDEDKVSFKGISGKYGIENFNVNKYPLWRIEAWQKEISDIMNDLGKYIELGNSINIHDEDLFREKYARRSEYFENAIGMCHVLKDKFHEILLCIRIP